jgi:hypothetical protein
MKMKLVECEYAFDRKKVIFYFTAEDRVDFRELVRDLAREFKARIELRHIQVRDEAKIIGGIGSCGRELCCTTWLREFLPISMKMAKRQNLSLNPSKISGQCGRLLCCLAYENDLYQRGRRIDIPEAALPQDLGALRDEMEEDQSAAVGVLRESTLADVFEEETEEVWSEPVVDEGVQEFVAETGEEFAEAAETPERTEEPETQLERPRPQPRGRRRRRRGRGGGGRPQGGPTGN